MHGWVYSLHDGRVRELGMDVDALERLQPVYDAALAAVGRSGTRE